MYAYLDSADAVIATSTETHTLTQAQAINPLIASIVEDAPEALMVKGCETAECPFYHQYNSGSGTSIEDYDEVEVLSPLRLFRYQEIDARTQELISEGFVHSGSNRFRIDTEALCRYQAMYLTRNDGSFSYPVLVTTYDDNGVAEELSDAAEVSSFVLELCLGYIDLVSSGEDLKAQIASAATKAAIDAIVDNR